MFLKKNLQGNRGKGADLSLFWGGLGAKEIASPWFCVANILVIFATRFCGFSPIAQDSIKIRDQCPETRCSDPIAFDRRVPSRVPESYAGHYVPAVAHRIWAGAKRQEGFPMPLRGIGVGNAHNPDGGAM